MKNIPIVSLMIALSVILIIRILYKAWRSRQESTAIRRRPDNKSSAIHRSVASDTSPSPLQPPPIPPAPVAAARVTRDTVASIHDEVTSSPVLPEGSRSRIFGKSPKGSGIWNAEYVTASGVAQQAKSEAVSPTIQEDVLGDGSDLVFGPITTTLSSMLPESDDRRRELTRTLQNAGYYERNAWHNLASIRYLGIFLPIIVCGLLLVFGPPQLEPLLIGAIVFLPIVGWALPTLLRKSRGAAHNS